MSERIQEAYKTFIQSLFNEVPKNVRAYSISRKTYTEALRHVERTYNIAQGDPDYLEWVLTLIGQSPKIIEDMEE